MTNTTTRRRPAAAISAADVAALLTTTAAAVEQARATVDSIRTTPRYVAPDATAAARCDAWCTLSRYDATAARRAWVTATRPAINAPASYLRGLAALAAKRDASRAVYSVLRKLIATAGGDASTIKKGDTAANFGHFACHDFTRRPQERRRHIAANIGESGRAWFDHVENAAATLAAARADHAGAQAEQAAAEKAVKAARKAVKATPADTTAAVMLSDATDALKAARKAVNAHARRVRDAVSGYQRVMGDTVAEDLDLWQAAYAYLYEQYTAGHTPDTVMLRYDECGRKKARSVYQNACAVVRNAISADATAQAQTASYTRIVAAEIDGSNDADAHSIAVSIRGVKHWDYTAAADVAALIAQADTIAKVQAACKFSAQEQRFLMARLAGASTDGAARCIGIKEDTANGLKKRIRDKATKAGFTMPAAVDMDTAAAAVDAAQAAADTAERQYIAAVNRAARAADAAQAAAVDAAEQAHEQAQAALKAARVQLRLAKAAQAAQDTAARDAARAARDAAYKAQSKAPAARVLTDAEKAARAAVETARAEDARRAALLADSRRRARDAARAAVVDVRAAYVAPAAPALSACADDITPAAVPAFAAACMGF